MCVAVSCHCNLEGEGTYGDGRIVVLLCRCEVGEGKGAVVAVTLSCCREVGEGETGGTLLLLS